MREKIEGREGDKITLEVLRKLSKINKNIFDIGYISNNFLIMIKNKKFKLTYKEIINYLNKNNFGYKEIILNYDPQDTEGYQDLYIIP